MNAEDILLVVCLTAVIAWLMRTGYRAAARAVATPVRELRSGRIVDPGAPPSPRELEAYKAILRRGGLPGWGVAGVVYLVVAFSLMAILPRVIQGLSIREAGEGALPLALLAGLFTYVTRLAVCECPRCNRRLFSWLFVLALIQRTRLGWSRPTVPLSKACLRCGTPFISPEGRLRDTAVDLLRRD